MSEISSRRGSGSASQQTRSTRSVRRLVGGGIGAIVLVVAAACGFNAQTLKPYTPAEGVNINVGTGSNGEPVASTVEVRGLMILSKEAGSGFLSASLLTRGSDSLTGVSGYVIKTDGSQGSALEVTLSSPIELSSNELVVLTDSHDIAVSSSDLAAGQTVNITLTFANAGSQQVIAPIIDANFAPYNTVSPSPSSTASPSASPSS